MSHVNMRRVNLRRHRDGAEGPYRVEDGVVVNSVGAICYDFLEAGEAEVIRDVLNEGMGPNWYDIRDEVYRRLGHQ